MQLNELVDALKSALESGAPPTDSTRRQEVIFDLHLAGTIKRTDCDATAAVGGIGVSIETPAESDRPRQRG